MAEGEDIGANVASQPQRPKCIHIITSGSVRSIIPLHEHLSFSYFASSFSYPFREQFLSFDVSCAFIDDRGNCFYHPAFIAIFCTTDGRHPLHIAAFRFLSTHSSHRTHIHRTSEMPLLRLTATMTSLVWPSASAHLLFFHQPKDQQTTMTIQSRLDPCHRIAPHRQPMSTSMSP